jgi:microcystin-dependent protein
MGTGVWDASKLASRPDNLGFPADTLPAPAVYGPQAGDLYINLSSGKVTNFTGPAPSSRSTATFTGGTESPTLDVTQSSIAKLTDVDVATTAPKNGEVLTYDLTTTKWLPKKVATTLGDLLDVTESPAPQSGNVLIADGTGLWTEAPNPSYTKVELDTKLTTILTGLAHGVAVNDILNAPPINPVEGDAYIIGIAPLGIWAGKNDQVAFYSQGDWIYTAPYLNEAHLVEAKQATYAWSPPPGGVGANRWVKVASTGAASGTTAQHGVGEIIPWITDTIPEDYLECRGQIIAVSAYPELHAVISNKYNAGTAADGISTFALPDLRGYFLRGVGANGGEGKVGVVQNDTTRMPRSNFTGTTSSAGNHQHVEGASSWNALSNPFGSSTAPGGITGPVRTEAGWVHPYTSTTGDHTHNVTITGGGDVETRPKSISVRWVIRVKPIDGGAVGPRGLPGAGVPDGTAAGQKLEWNGTIWVPIVDKVTTTRSNEFVVVAAPAMYELQGGLWTSSDSLLQLKLFGEDGTTQLDPRTWMMKGMNTASVSTYSSLTTMTANSDTHCSRGFWVEANGAISLGRNAISNPNGWVEVDLKMVCTTQNGRGNAAAIIVRYSYLDNQDYANDGVLRLNAPSGTVIGKVVMTTGAATTYYNCAVRTSLL